MKLFLVASVFLCAIGTLIWVGIANAGTPVHKISELFDGATYKGGRVQVDEGKVVAIHSLASPLVFDYASDAAPGRKIRVETKRTAPENFKVGIEASIVGEFDASTGTFQAVKVSTQCPSKYDQKAQYEQATAATEEGAPEGEAPVGEPRRPTAADILGPVSAEPSTAP